ncbi:MAG: TatD family hydrolase, partial [Magnetococcales bacterium]|nr:TatD family hydrolase [Magnetococcales bacterium]
MIRFADSHAHLNFPDFQEDLPAVIQRAAEVGVGYINSITTRLTEVEPLLAMLQPYPHVYTSVGIHPHHVAEAEDASVEAILAHCH